MVAILTTAPSCAITTNTTTFAFHALQQPLLRLPISFRTPDCNLLSLTTTTSSNRPNYLTKSTTPRRLLCKPPSAKYVREDYLVKKFSAEEVEELLEGERNVPVIVDFYATWCGPCIFMAQELEMLAVEYESNALFIKVDTDDEHEFARAMQIRGLPTLLFFSPDPRKDPIRTEGLIPKQMIRDIIDNEM